MPRARHPILVVRSFQDKPCHCCGSLEQVWFLRFRQGNVRDNKSPSEVYLRLCEDCKLMLLQELEDSTNGQSAQALDANRSGEKEAIQGGQGRSRQKESIFRRRRDRKF